MKKLAWTCAIVFVLISLGILFKPFAPSIINIASGIAKPRYKETTDYTTGNYGYKCSKPIKVKKELKWVHHLGGSNYEYLYLPISSDEARIYCATIWTE